MELPLDPFSGEGHAEKQIHQDFFQGARRRSPAVSSRARERSAPVVGFDTSDLSDVALE